MAEPAQRVVASLRSVLSRALVAPVREGRIAEHDWPYGLRAVILLAYVAFAVAGVLVVASGPIRRSAVLDTAGSAVVGLPESTVWVLVTLFSFGLSLLLSAALHAPWWLRLLALLVVLAALGAWALRGPGTSGSVWWTVLVPVLLLALVVLVVLRARRPFAWWELGAVWCLVGAGLVVGLVENRYAASFGSDEVPSFLQYLASVLGYLVLPTAMVAGAPVAEVCLRLTVAVTGQVRRWRQRRVPFAVLGLVVVVRGVQVGRQVVGLDPLTQGWDVVLGSVLLVDALGDELTGVALPVGATLIVVDLLVAPVRAVVGLVVVLLALRAARRGRAARAGDA